MDIQGGLASLIPLNARTFLKNALRDEDDVGSLISAEDLSEAEVEEIYRRVDKQDAINAQREENLLSEISGIEKHRDEYPATPAGISTIRSGSFIGGTYDPPRDALRLLAGRPARKSTFIPSNPDVIWGESELSDDERLERNLDVFNRDMQSRLDDVRLKAESFEKTRGKTSVRRYEDVGSGRATFTGPTIVESITESFTSPAYNINTTLGQFNAFKNEDGTVTIRDTYDWTGQKGSPYKHVGDMSMWDFIKIVPIMVARPEAAGNVIMRTLFKDKSSPVEFTLPPRKNLTTEMPEGYREGGRVRLI